MQDPPENKSMMGRRLVESAKAGSSSVVEELLRDGVPVNFQDTVQAQVSKKFWFRWYSPLLLLQKKKKKKKTAVCLFVKLK